MNSLMDGMSARHRAHEERDAQRSGDERDDADDEKVRPPWHLDGTHVGLHSAREHADIARDRDAVEEQL